MLTLYAKQEPLINTELFNNQGIGFSYIFQCSWFLDDADFMLVDEVCCSDVSGYADDVCGRPRGCTPPNGLCLDVAVSKYTMFHSL